MHDDAKQKLIQRKYVLHHVRYLRCPKSFSAKSVNNDDNVTRNRKPCGRLDTDLPARTMRNVIDPETDPSTRQCGKNVKRDGRKWVGWVLVTWVSGNA